MSCSILNLPACIVEQFSDFIVGILNAPFVPFLEAVKFFLTQPPSIDTFAPLWGVMIYILSTFYGLSMLGAGFNFIISGYDPAKRERAKDWLQNTILMILFVQSSFLIYSLIAELASGISSGVVNMIDPSFFMITLDNMVNVGLEIILGMFYLFVLLVTIVVLSINYLIASIGVLFFPFGIFFYFIPPLRDIGKFIIDKLVFILFLPFFASLILLASSEIVKIGVFANVKIILMMGAFSMINSLMILIALLALLRGVMSVFNSSLVRGLLFLKGGFLAGAAMVAKKPEENLERRPPRRYQ